MFTSIKISKNKAVPYLHNSKMAKTYENEVHFSNTKVNVIVGPNGSGKSALMKALALHSFSWFTGESSLNAHYHDNYRVPLWPDDVSRWSKPVFMEGLEILGDDGPVAFFRPGALPGDENDITTAMLCGYFEEAKKFGKLIADKSSGEKHLAVQQRIWDMLTGNTKPKWGKVNWRHNGKDLIMQSNNYYSAGDIIEDLMHKRVKAIPKTAKPAILMDEPEQSLDTLAEVQLWNTLSNVNCNQLQVIVATHSIHPFLHPERFNIIEAVPGFRDQVLAAI